MGAAEKVTGISDLIKIENTLFVLPFVYIGMIYAVGFVLITFILITIALVCARGAAFAANRYIGRDYDIKNPKKKAWKSMVYSKNELLAIFFIFALIFVISAYLLNNLALVLSPLILFLIISEPFAKRYTVHRHFIMGFVIGLGIIGGYIGGAGAFPTTLPLYILFIGYALYSGANDIIYSLNHVEFDKKNNLKTYPVKYGIKSSIRYSHYAHFIAGLLFVLFGVLSSSLVIAVGGAFATILMLAEHHYLDYKKEKTVAISFFAFNVAVSLIMLLSVLISNFL